MTEQMDVETWARMLEALDIYRLTHDEDCTCTACMDFSIIQYQVSRPAAERYTYRNANEVIETI
jgi:hypothetical protein